MKRLIVVRWWCKPQGEEKKLLSNGRILGTICLYIVETMRLLSETWTGGIECSNVTGSVYGWSRSACSVSRVAESASSLRNLLQILFEFFVPIHLNLIHLNFSKSYIS